MENSIHENIVHFFFVNKTRSWLHRRFQINEELSFKVRNSAGIQKKLGNHQLYQNFKSTTVTSQSLLKGRRESGKSQSSYIKFYASGMSVRASPRDRLPSSSAAAAILRHVQADCFLSRRFNGRPLIGPPT